MYASLKNALYVIKKSLPEAGLRRFVCSSLLKPSFICRRSSVRHLVTCQCCASLFTHVIHPGRKTSKSSPTYTTTTYNNSAVSYFGSWPIVFKIEALRCIVRISVRLRINCGFTCTCKYFTYVGQRAFRQFQRLILAQPHHLEICLFIHMNPILPTVAIFLSTYLKLYISPAVPTPAAAPIPASFRASVYVET